MKKTLTSAATVQGAFITLVSLGMLVPMYILVVNTFKSQQEILGNPFTLDLGTATFQHLADAWNNPDFSIPKGYGTTITLVLCVNVLAMGVCAPRHTYWPAPRSRCPGCCCSSSSQGCSSRPK